jgi:hypothetical protein
MFTAIRRALSRVSDFTADLKPHSPYWFNR